MSMNRQERAAYADAVAKDVSAEAAKLIMGVGATVGAEKEAPFVDHYRRPQVEKKLRDFIYGGARRYFKAAYETDEVEHRSLRSDWDGDFMSDVLMPSIKMLWDYRFVPAKYQGFGPRSIVTRIKKDPWTPSFGKKMEAADKEFREETKA